MGSRANERYLTQLLTFLNSDYFKQPILQFLERHCLTFDTSDLENPDNVRLHEKYRLLIDKLLDGHEDEFGLMDEQIIGAVKDMNARVTGEEINKELYRYIQAADDRAQFTQLMLNTNVAFREDMLSFLLKYDSDLPKNIQPLLTNQEKPFPVNKDELLKRLAAITTKESNYILEGGDDKEKQRSNLLKQLQEKMLVLNSKERKELLAKNQETLHRPRTMKAAAATMDENWQGIPDEKEPPKLNLRRAIAKRLQTEVLVRTT